MASPDFTTGSTGYVYLIEAVGFHLVKIGYTTNVAARLQQLSTGTPAPLRVLKQIECVNPGPLERDMHRRYAAFKRHNEWFALPFDVLAALLSEDWTPVPPSSVPDISAPERISPETWRRMQEHQAKMLQFFTTSTPERSIALWIIARMQRLHDIDLLKDPMARARLHDEVCKLAPEMLGDPLKDIHIRIPFISGKDNVPIHVDLKTKYLNIANWANGRYFM